MTSLRSTVLTVGLLAVLTTTGCKGSASDEGSAGPDWARVAAQNLNCADDIVAVVDSVDKHDIDGDAVDDYFVTRRCTSTANGSPRGGQLEVFRGGTDREHPVRLGVIVRDWQGYTLTGCIAFVEGKAYTLGTKGRDEVVWAAQLSRGRVVGLVSDERSSITGCS